MDRDGDLQGSIWIWSNFDPYGLLCFLVDCKMLVEKETSWLADRRNSTTQQLQDLLHPDEHSDIVEHGPHGRP